MSTNRSASMSRIARLVGLPPVYFRDMYSDLVDQFEAHIRSSHLTNHNDELLDYSLALAERALNIRQSYLLPENEPPEIVARKSDLWTYGVFLAALLDSLSKITASSAELAEAAVSLVPEAVLDWLSADPNLMEAWLAVVIGDRSKSGVVGKIVTEARRQLGGDELSEDSKESTPSSDIIMGLRQIIDDGELSVNCIGGDAWITDEDLWLSSKEGLNRLRSWLIDWSDATSLQNNELMNMLQALDLCLPTPEKNLAAWHVVIKENGQQKSVAALRFPIAAVWPNPADRPSSFGGAIHLRNKNQAVAAA